MGMDRPNNYLVSNACGYPRRNYNMGIPQHQTYEYNNPEGNKKTTQILRGRLNMELKIEVMVHMSNHK
jgi:hypothetical protein